MKRCDPRLCSRIALRGANQSADQSLLALLRTPSDRPRHRRVRAFALNERMAVWLVTLRYDPWEASEALLGAAQTQRHPRGRMEGAGTRVGVSYHQMKQRRRPKGAAIGAGE
jgi:hypothetical protein